MTEEERQTLLAENEERAAFLERGGMPYMAAHLRRVGRVVATLPVSADSGTGGDS